MSERESELRFLARNVEAVETVASSTIMSQIISLMETGDKKYRVIDLKEFNQLISGYNKIDDAIVELKNLIHSINGAKAEPEPHGSRDTFVPKPKGPMTQDEWLESMREKEEIANAFEDYNAMQD
jgi:hypothetical protein